MTTSRVSARRVVVHVPERVVLLDVAGPADVFATATLLGGGRPYQTVLVSREGGSMPAWNGMQLQTVAAGEIVGRIDTLVVPGSMVSPEEVRSPVEQDQLRRLASLSDRVASVCTGAFRLAATGLLDGHEATTHWAYRQQFAAHYPAVTLVEDRLHVTSSRYWSTAGASAGIDLALAMVEADHGTLLAREVASWLVLYLRRPGSQPQISSHLAADASANTVVTEALSRIAAHPGDDHSLTRLARQAGLSERHFARVFRRETGLNAADHVTRVRLETARRLLETTGLRVADVARRSGFGRAETLDRAYRRYLGTTPTRQRREQSATSRPGRRPDDPDGVASR